MHSTSHEAFLDRARELGETRQGRLHSSLGSDGGDPQFAPEVPGDEALSAW